ncbi:MAG: hypothetical protein EOP00_00095 [Pedobacter sp.]|nr:MAG: hypothetical protein EOP00_00095 [Pedobacter sp.]
MENIPVKKSKTKKVLKIVGLFFLLLIVVAGVTEYIYRNEMETPLYKVQQYLTYSKEDWANYENNKRLMAESANDTTNVDYATSAPQSPIDTTMWENAIKNKDYIPENVMEEITNYKKRDFSKLQVAEDKPTDEEAQEAIVRNYQNEVASLLKQYKAHIKIGVCYAAPL